MDTGKFVFVGVDQMGVFKSKSSDQIVCHVCGVSHKKLKKIDKKLDRKPKTSMFSGGGFMVGAQVGGEYMQHCNKCGKYVCSACTKRVDLKDYRHTYLCPNCDNDIGYGSRVED